MRVLPRGSTASSPRTITDSSASRGSPSSRTRQPTTAWPGSTGYSTISAPSRRIVPVSASGRGRAGSLVVTPNQRESGSMLRPWTSVDTTTTKKTTLKNMPASLTPSITG